jgi:16S rRNA (guanine527-N7)-methyltransferase
LIVTGARQQGIDVPKTALACFSAHARELLLWNRSINLTAITAAEEMAVKHFLDSLLAAHLIPRGASLLDIGSGGGFPGLPLKCLRPSLQVVLIDAVRKKVNFLKHIIRQLGLQGIEAVHARAENLADQPQFAGVFDVVVSRAFSELAVFVTHALPFVAPGGKILAMKGNPNSAEMRRLHIALEGETAARPQPFAVRVERFTLPPLEEKRSIVVIDPSPSA